MEDRRRRPLRQATSRSEILTLHVHPTIKRALVAAATEAGVSLSTIAAQLLTATVQARFPIIEEGQPYRPD